MSSLRQLELTAEQLAVSQSRKTLKSSRDTQQSKTPPILRPRQWLPIPSADHNANSPSHRVKVLSWNLLAQCLIRRELFPSSSCLKAVQREPMIHEEIKRQDADILCLQEVDRTERLLPMLDQAGYSHVYASGPHKLHGCLIAFKTNLYTLDSHKAIFYDDQDVPIAGSESQRRGGSFRTKNIASLVALRLNSDSAQGIVVATTHLFWHPRYTYERIRQLGILIRETDAFRKNQSFERWPCIIAGDFNFTPKDSAYSLLFGDPLLSTQEQAILDSRVVHATIDPTVLNTVTSKARKDDDEESDPDRIITNARLATLEDGLLTIPDIVAWFSNLPRLRSAYSEGLRRAKDAGFELKTYGTRELLPVDQNGYDEPEYTSYTFYWKSVLDYIFFLDVKETVTVTGLVKPPSVQDLDPGIPKHGVSGSDHTALIAEITWQLEQEQNQISVISVQHGKVEEEDVGKVECV